MGLRGLRVTAVFFIYILLSLLALPPIYACGYCENPPYHGRPSPPISTNPPNHGKGTPKISPPSNNPRPMPPVINPPVTIPPPSSTYPPYVGNPPSGGGGLLPPIGGLTPPGGGGGGGGGGGYPGINPPPSTHATCPIDALKLGLCVDVLGGLVHIGLGDPIENQCCPVLQGLLELEAAICLCTTLRLKLLNLNIFIPLALQVLITCGKSPPPGFVCPPL
ncbi:Bifunctional inhibitor/plant lipid transfer protein/seed storage helical domain [Macleaya cordata]|uniref:Bifunctional inhibitor/plant lipid transfer protein/seed storage helical domain n=1 Tax=Macleaya cordata TaxID=56857 RepID=A0A200QKH7_MACCD|nr:Bifunctional inhibitor/plant lipid transfer protein/seed storage helical domain [Macleaya cordata]